MTSDTEFLREKLQFQPRDSPGIRKLAEFTDASLAVSLHAPNDEVRNKLVPINRKYPIAELLGVCREYIKVLGEKRTVTIEYTLLEGVMINRCMHFSLPLSYLGFLAKSILSHSIHSQDQIIVGLARGLYAHSKRFWLALVCQLWFAQLEETILMQHVDNWLEMFEIKPDKSQVTRKF